jgi:hypothetical protein
MNDQEETPTSRPAWVVWMAIAMVALVFAAIAVMVLVPGEHGPGRHM